MADPLSNLRDLFAVLHREIRTSIRIHIGDVPILEAQRSRLSAFLENLNRVCPVFARFQMSSVTVLTLDIA